ncbi:MAG: amino-acid N-acetyltransferase [Gammaproteobacteria bacterium]
MQTEEQQFVAWCRGASPYIRAHRGATFVIYFGGEVASRPSFSSLVHDIALLASIGVRIAVVHGARPQIEAGLHRSGSTPHVHRGLRVTDAHALACAKAAVGALRVEIEALFSMGPAASRPRVASGNFVTARPLGVRNGIDYHFTGEVRRIDTEGIQSRLENGEIVLLSPLGYSPSGEVFNLSALEVAESVAIALCATKLILLVENPGISDARSRLLRQLTQREAEQQLAQDTDEYPELRCAVRSCRAGVGRIHLVDSRIDGVLLLDLFTRDGSGTMISRTPYDQMRTATVDDVAGVLELIAPLEERGILVRRSREKLELEIGHFIVLVRDQSIIGCAALYPYPQEGLGELACLVVHPDYRNAGHADEMLCSLARQAEEINLKRLFVLTTQAAHWFMEREFVEAPMENLPLERQGLYNYQRNSKIFIRDL